MVFLQVAVAPDVVQRIGLADAAAALADDDPELGFVVEFGGDAGVGVDVGAGANHGGGGFGEHDRVFRLRGGADRGVVPGVRECRTKGSS